MLLLMYFCPQILYHINMLNNLAYSVLMPCPTGTLIFTNSNESYVYILCQTTQVFSCLELKFLPLLEERVFILVLSHK